jgi:hypothetical protein
MASRGRRRSAGAGVVEEDEPAPAQPPWKHASAFEVRADTLRISARLTRAPPQSAAKAEAFLSCVVREALSAKDSAAQGSGGAFEHLEALTQELQRCAGDALAACASRLTAILILQRAGGAGGARDARSRSRQRVGGTRVAAGGFARGTLGFKQMLCVASALNLLLLAGKASCAERLRRVAAAAVWRA